MLDAALPCTLLQSYQHPFGMTAGQADQDLILLILWFCTGRRVADAQHAQRADHLGFFAAHDIGQGRVLDETGDDVDYVAASGLHGAQGSSDLIDRNRY